MTLLLAVEVIVAIVVATVVPIVVLVVLFGKKKPDERPAVKEATSDDSPVASKPEPQKDEPKAEKAAETEPEKSPEAKPEPKPEPAKEDKPPTLEVEALSPSTTGEAPMLAADDGELKMATDELPRVATAEMPGLTDTGPAKYRTPAAQELADAIESGDCPNCKAPTFVGSAEPQEVGADGTAMYSLNARCGACGHKANLIDMRVS